MGQQRSIDDSIEVLDRIVADARGSGSYLAVFPAMYRSVTSEVRRANSEGFFEDAARLERLVVAFADLYVDAIRAHGSGSDPPACWELAFRTAESRRRRSILQHLLLGMNAHINFDLGIATAQAAAGGELAALYGDYLRVNEVLFALVDHSQADLNAVSPWMGLVDRAGLGIDEGFMKLGLRTCRDRAWRFAERLANADEHSRAVKIQERDADVRRLGQLISNRLSLFHAVNLVIRTRESRDIGTIVDAFDQQAVDLDRVETRVIQQLGQSLPDDASLDRSRRRSRR